MKNIYRLNLTYRVNALLYSIRNMPVLSFFFDGNLLYEENFRKYMQIPYMIIFGILKIIEYSLLLLFPFILFDEIETIYIYFLVMSLCVSYLKPITCFNTFANIGIEHLRIEASQYFKDNIRIYLLETFIFFVLSIYLLNFYFDIPLLPLLVLSSLYLFSKFIVEFIYLLKKSKKIFISNKLVKTLAILSFISIISTVFILKNAHFSIMIVVFNYIIFLFLGVYSFWKIIYDINFKFLAKRYLKREYILLEERKIWDISTSFNIVQDLKFDKNVVSEKSGVAYLHDLFHQRFYSEIKGRDNYICNLLLLMILAIILVFILQIFGHKKILLGNIDNIQFFYLVIGALLEFINFNVVSYLRICNREIDSKLSKHYWFNLLEEDMLKKRYQYIKCSSFKNIILLILFALLFYFTVISSTSYLEIIYVVLLLLLCNFVLGDILLLVYYHFRFYKLNLKKAETISNCILWGFLVLIEVVFNSFCLIKILFLLFLFILHYLIKIYISKKGDYYER